MADRIQPTGKPHLSVVIPAYNESVNLGEHLPRVFEWFLSQNIHGEVVVADDGSRDDTAQVAKSLIHGHPGRVVHTAENCGKGHAVRQGFAAAAGRWVLITDADLSTPLDEYTRLADVARDRDLDIVIGSRGLPDSRIEKHQNPVRETMGKTFNKIVRSLTGLKFHDTQCGFKLLHRARTAPLFELMRVDGFAWDVEMLYLAVRFGLSVAELPVTWRNDECSSVNIVSDPPRMIVDVLRVRWGFRVGAYDPAKTTAGRKAS